MAHEVTLIPGDGIGPEITEAARRVVESTGVEINWHTVDAGQDIMAEYGTPLPDNVLQAIGETGVALKGPVTTPVGSGFRSVNVTLRQALDLYVNLRPALSIPGVKSRYDDIDLVIVRENTEDLYAGIEHMVGEDAAESIKIITRKASERVTRFAFEYAIAHGRRKVTAVHKANIMKMADGLFLECMRKCARDYPEIEYEELIVDNTCMQLVTRPERFDVMVMENLYGDIISDLCSGLVGGLGVTPSGNYGAGGTALFEAVHGSAPDIAGKNLANPIAMILSAVLMLRHIHETEKADMIEKAVHAVLEEGKFLTRDLGGVATTTEITNAIIDKME